MSLLTPLEAQRIDAEEKALDKIHALLGQTKNKPGLTARQIADGTGLAIGYVNKLLQSSTLVLRRRPRNPRLWYCNWDDISSDDKPFCGRKWRPDRKRGRPPVNPKTKKPVSVTPIAKKYAIASTELHNEQQRSLALFDDMTAARKERDELRAWKDSALAVEAEWDAQATARILGAPLGVSCRKFIGEKVPLLVAERDQLRVELEKWKSGCVANADDAKDCHRRADEQRLQILSLKAEVEALRAMLSDSGARFKCTGCGTDGTWDEWRSNLSPDKHQCDACFNDGRADAKLVPSRKDQL